MNRDWPRIVATVAFAVVSLVAASISYDHIHEVTGDHWYAAIMPLSVDGLLVAGSIALYLERSQGRWGGALAWTAVVLGLSASLAANVAAADPGLQGVLVAGWPPVALALSFELLIRVRRRDPAPMSEAPGEPVTVGEAVAVAAPPVGPAGEWSFDDAVAWAIQENAGAKRIQTHTKLSEYKAKQAAKQARESARPRLVAR